MAGRRYAQERRAEPAPRAAASNEMERLRTQLLESLTSTISDTVDTVCEEFEESLGHAIQQVPKGSSSTPSRRASATNGGGINVDDDYDLYYKCCQRLVAYICANMETAPDFAQQMDRIILACHSNASERVLRSVVTKSLWFHRREDGDEDNEQDDDQQEQEEAKPEVKHEMKKGKRVVPRAPPQRGTKRPPPPPPPPPPATRRTAPKAPVKKRARRESIGRRAKYVDSDENEEPEEEEEEEEEKEEKDVAPVKKRTTPTRRRQNRIKYSDDEEEETKQDGDDDDDEDEVQFLKEEGSSQPHYGHADELLTFKDAIGDMCYPNRRTPAQTRFFKERLRKAIQFVDAQLCKPPKGKSCGWECTKIRRQMCNRDLPCRNKICRLWHDVEAHTDRCQNQYCEFRIRVMLRETMYKIDHKRIELQDCRNELHKKNSKLLELKHENLSDRETYVERRLLDNEIGQLETDLEEAEKDLGVFKATKKAYWTTLNEIGITEEDDANDEFPEFTAHYQAKKASAAAAKKKSPTKPAHKHDDENEEAAAAAAARAARQRRRESVAARPPSMNMRGVRGRCPGSAPVERERIARRSTQQSVQAMTSGVIELDDDDDDEEEVESKEDETKSDRSVDKNGSKNDSHHEDDNAEAANDDDAETRETAEDEDMEPPAHESEPAAEEEEPTADATDVATAEQEGENDEPMAEETTVPDEEEQEEPPTEPEPVNGVREDNDTQSADYVLEDPPTDAQSTPNEPVEASTSTVVVVSSDDNGPLLPF